MSKILLIFLLFIFASHLHATSCSSPAYCQQQGLMSYTPNSPQACSRCVSICPEGTYVTNGFSGATCVSSYPNNNQFCLTCQGYPNTTPYYPISNMNMPWFYSMNYQPWWVTQGQFYYPNFNYPGAWQNNGFNTYYYTGNNHAMALKPNIYVQQSGLFAQNFSLSFELKDKMEFLATTPKLTKFSWAGEVKGEKFIVNNVTYDYMFYDARFDHKKLQFDHGTCVEKEGLVSLMLKNLKEMKFTESALIDFEEHWKVKIPDYPYFCVYPQYNKEMEAVSPLNVIPKDAHVVRVLYMLVPHVSSPKSFAGQFPQLPRRSVAAIIPLPKEARITFYEWGVGFLSSEMVVP